MNFKNMGSSDGRDTRPPATPLPLARQSSVYSLTFDELQSTMGGFGKDFGSMNMDEFLKNVWTAEESQAMAVASAVAGPGAGDAGAGPSGLPRQGSLTLPRTLSQKTVDEVWRDLVPPVDDFRQQRQPTLGEMTLEEFLVRAGVVREDINQTVNQPAPRPIISNANNNNRSILYNSLTASNNNQGLVLGFGQPERNNPIQGGSVANLSMTGASTRPYPAPLALGNAADIAGQQRMGGGGIMGIGNPVMNNGLMRGGMGLGGCGVTVAAVGSPANQISSDGPAKDNGDLSSLSPMPYVFGEAMRGRKRSGAVEKVVERRQRRMIKNRESAARSRARKQAYTMELEAEVAKLKEQNQELQKRQAEIIEMQKNQVQEMINQQQGPKKICLRRTQTGPW